MQFMNSTYKQMQYFSDSIKEALLVENIYDHIDNKESTRWSTEHYNISIMRHKKKELLFIVFPKNKNNFIDWYLRFDIFSSVLLENLPSEIERVKILKEIKTGNIVFEKELLIPCSLLESFRCNKIVENRGISRIEILDIR